MELVIKNIIKKFGNINAVNNVSLTVEKGEMLALIGPSGCGKTTLLRIVAGLVSQNSGRIFLRNKDISKMPAQNRNTAMVFQNYALFPHLSVYQNVAYGLKIRKIDNQIIKMKVQKALNRVNLNGLENRLIQELSGGQQQRVALARVLVIEPDILLFDEPLSNLDEKLRIKMRKEIKRIQKEVGITSIYVTHDQEEALSIADRIAVMNDGKIQQIDSPDNLYYKPINSFVANFIGQANLVDGCIVNENNNNITVNVLGKLINLNTKVKKLKLMIRPEEIKLGDGNITAKVIWRENLGSISRYLVTVDDTEIVVDILNRKNNLIYQKGDKVNLDFDEKAIHIIEH